jgi:hypothetical protein
LRPGEPAEQPGKVESPVPGSRGSTADDAVAERERRRGKRSAIWTYHNAEGEPVGVIVRGDQREGKNTLQIARNGDGWIIGGMPEPRPLDRFPDLADAWRLYLVEHGLAESTIRRRCGRAKQFFRSAVRRKLISENPFEDLKATTQPNPTRSYFLSRARAKRVIDACPDAQRRLLFLLARFGGLRAPSEKVKLAEAGVEPARGINPHGILSPVRLPIPPLGRLGLQGLRGLGGIRGRVARLPWEWLLAPWCLSSWDARTTRVFGGRNGIPSCLVAVTRPR